MNIRHLMIAITFLLGTAQIHAVLKNRNTKSPARSLREENRKKAERLRLKKDGQRAKTALKFALAHGTTDTPAIEVALKINS